MPSWDRNPPGPAQASRGRRLRPPPENGSRFARWRLFVLVAALMTVLVAMNEARKPRNWAWMWRGVPAESPDPPIQTLLPPQAEVPENPPGTVIADPPEKVDLLSTDSDQSTVNRPQDEAGDLDPRKRQPQRAWQRVWEGLTIDERNRFSTLLRTARRGEIPTEEAVSAWLPLIQRLVSNWDRFLTEENRQVLLRGEEVATERRHAALAELTELEALWNKRWRPAVEAAGHRSGWTPDQRAALAEVQPILDQIALALVRDDTVWPPQERTAWLRLIEMLQQSDAADFSRQSLGNVSFVQIFRQSPEYRGKVVTVRGTVRLAYRVPAPKNDLDIRDYCVFWIQPEDGSNLPIAVYALNAPQGFPAITSQRRELREPVEVTGYFFKRFVYRAADGLRSAPMIVAAVPAWKPIPPSATAHQRFATNLGVYFWPAVGAGILVLAGVACGIAWLANRSTRTSRALSALRAAADSTVWENLPATSTVEESLRKLSDLPLQAHVEETPFPKRTP